MVRAQGADLRHRGVDSSGNGEKVSGTRAEQERGEEVMSLEIVRGCSLFCLPSLPICQHPCYTSSRPAGNLRDRPLCSRFTFSNSCSCAELFESPFILYNLKLLPQSRVCKVSPDILFLWAMVRFCLVFLLVTIPQDSVLLDSVTLGPFLGLPWCLRW